MPCALGFPAPGGAHSGARGAGAGGCSAGCPAVPRVPGGCEGAGLPLRTATAHCTLRQSCWGGGGGGRCCPAFVAPTNPHPVGTAWPGSPAPSLRPWGFGTAVCRVLSLDPGHQLCCQGFFWGGIRLLLLLLGPRLSPPGVPHEAAWCCAWLSWVLLVSPQRLGTAHPSVTRVSGEMWLFFSLQGQSQQIKSKYPCLHANELWGTPAPCPGTGIHPGCAAQSSLSPGHTPRPDLLIGLMAPNVTWQQ